MKKKHYTTIAAFEVMHPTDDFEQVGDRIQLHETGEYRPHNSTVMRGYSLLDLISHPAHYRISEITMHGINYVIPADREMNYRPKHRTETMKYYIGSVKNELPKQSVCLHDWDFDNGRHGVYKCRKCGKFNC